MDATAVANRLRQPVPANRTFGISVQHAGKASTLVTLQVQPRFANVIGSPHASGLMALIDATGLAAMIAVTESEGLI